ncbi:MAG: hypothetical protein HZB41_08790 [Ignavibacteriae bacterium]|nr:hypothetical protein [Ignavibacteriota bacterium]
MKFYFQIILLLQIITITAFPEINNISPEKRDKCGTFLTLEQKKKILSSLCNNLDTNGRCIQQKTFPSASGKFLIHFDTSGINSVNLTDNDLNDIPDYIDSVAYYFDYAYNVEVDSIGYLAPPPDYGCGGSDAYDVYVFNLGDFHVNPDPLYGYTTTDSLITRQRKFQCFTSYITIDNDYSPFDSDTNQSGDTVPTFTETGIMGMKITAAHELHHAIQYNYGISVPGTGSLYEMTSVWMENRLFSESKDYYSHLKTLFKNPEYYPFGKGNDEIGYKYGIFCQYTWLNFGDVVLKRMWEIIGCDYPGFYALDSAYKEQGTSLVSEWCKFLPWLYYTGSRSIPNKYFPSASEYPEIKFWEDTTFTQLSLINPGYLKPFEFRAFRYKLPSEQNKSDDTLDIIVTNIDLKTAIEQSPNDKYFEILCVNYDKTGTRPIGNTKYFYGMNANEGFIVDSLFFSAGTVFYSTSPVFPNPYRTSLHEKLYFPVPENSLINHLAFLNIYKTDMGEIYNTILNISTYQNIKVAILDEIPLELTSGVYIFSIEYHGKKEYGKLVIIRD